MIPDPFSMPDAHPPATMAHIGRVVVEQHALVRNRTVKKKETRALLRCPVCQAEARLQKLATMECSGVERRLKF